MFCVNVKSKEFKEACNRLNIHSSSLEVIVFQYLNNIDAESFPSDEYIMSKLEGKAMTDASESQILLWEKAYSTPKIFSDKDSVGAFIKEASKYFSPDSISIYRNNEGQYVARVTKPENREDHEKEIKRILDNAPRNEQGQLLAPNGKPTKLSERQYAQVRTKAFKKWFGDWTKITKNEDGTWNIPNDVSKVIDTETGEPKIMYHGTPWGEFNVFKHFQPNTGDRTPSGQLYFSTNKLWAESYTRGEYNKGNNTPKVYEVFLNIRNPYSQNETINSMTQLIEILHSFYDAVNNDDIYSKISDEVIKDYNLNINSSYPTPYLTSYIYTIISNYYQDNLSEIEFNKFTERLIKHKGKDGMIFLTGAELKGKPLAITDVKRQMWVINSNQIKSATDNVGTFSTESDDIRFSYIGSNAARRLDMKEESIVRMHGLYIAREMVKKGRSKHEIKRVTGWEIGKDGRWRYEIDEEIKEAHIEKLVLDPEGVREKRKERIKELEKEGNSELIDKYSVIYDDFVLEEVIGYNNPLFTAYPDMRGIRVSIENRSSSNMTINGSYSPTFDSIKIVIDSGTNFFREANTLVHEIQHAIQKREGFAKGGSPEAMPKNKEYEEKEKQINSLIDKVTKLSVPKYSLLTGNTSVIQEEDIKVLIEGINDEELLQLIPNNGEIVSANLLDILHKKLEEITKLQKNYQEQQYKRLAGETEARSAALNRGLTEEERRHILYSDGEVSLEDQIIMEEGISNSEKASEQLDNLRILNDNINNILDYLASSLHDNGRASLVHKRNGVYYVTKSAFDGGNTQSVIETYAKSKEIILNYLIAEGIPADAISFIDNDNSVMIVANPKGIQDAIKRNEESVKLGKLFESSEEAQKVLRVLNFLSNKTGLKYKVIPEKEAIKIIGTGNGIRKVNAFVKGDTCYFIEGRQLNVDIAAEEMLHPFVASIRKSNPGAFNSLLKDAKKAFPKLRLEIEEAYKDRDPKEIEEEIVTQALSRAFREDIKNTPEGHSVKELIKNFINRIVEIFQSFFGENNSEVITEYKTRVDEILEREEITAQDLQSTITINELAEIVNSGLKLYSPNIEGTRMNVESSSKLETKTIDEQYMEDSTALISQIEDLGNIGLSPSEIKHLGEQLMWWISDHLTWLQNNPSKLEETYGIKDKDASLMSREELASLITPSQLMTKCVEAFTKRQFKSLSQKSKVRKIANNWRALMFLSAKTFADIEGFGIIDSAAGFNVLQKIQTLTEDYNNDNDVDSITETVGDIQEHWQVEFRTIDVMNAMTPEVRLALLQCYVLDKDGNPIISEFGIKERIKPRQAVNTILRIAQGQITVEGIVKKLRDNRDQYPWFDQLIARLEDQSGANSNFKSAFFSTFCKPFVAYSVVRKNPSTGIYESVIVNEFPALREAMNTITTQYKMRQHPMLGDTLNMDTFNAVKDIYTSLKDVKFADVNVEELVDKLTYVYNALGYYVTPDLVSNIITESNYKTIVENLGYIINNLTEGYTNDNGTYDPFKFGRGNKNIITSTRAIIKIITDTLEDTAMSSTFDNGKMYQSYVTPSYLTKLMQKFTILSEEEFNKFMQEEYGQYKGWFTDSKGEYRLSWLRALSSSPEMRAIFKHKVQLNFNKHNYMRNMTDAEYTLSVISEFFAESDKAIGNYNVAWYRVPMMSNKPSSEFIRFIAHKGSFYKDTITNNMHDIFLQELSRIQTVRMRNKGKKDIDFIKNFDTNGAKFCFLDFFNEYLNGSQKTSTFGRILNKKLEGKELTEEEKSILIEESKKIIKEYMEAKAKGIIQEWKAQGIVAQCSKIKGINSANIESELENFIWNDTLASMNIIQMTVTDIAYYKDAEDLQKRFAQIHSPGVRGNNDARDFNNNKVTDGYHRTVYLADFEKVISNVIENITIVFDRKIKEAEDAGRTTEAESLKALKESLVGEKGAYREINVTDAQGYCCATSYRKKAFIFGKWNKAKEEVYNRLMQGDYTSTDLEIAFQPLKPFVYSQIPKSSGVADAPMSKLKDPIQNKNSEYLLLLAGAILQNEDTGKPNLLRAINEVMEESAEKSPTMGIDTIQFASAVKSSLTGVIDINDATSVEEAKERIRKAIYPDYKGDWKSYTPKVDYDERTVHKIPVEDYCIQQEVPPHFRDHDQAHGSQTRAIIIADLADGNYVIREGKTTRTVKKEEFIKEYEKTIAANIKEDINALAEELHLVGSSPAERNIAISRILQREILSNPNRYGTDLLVACSVDSNGNFRIPLGDPVQAKRVEQLINSIVKNRISKQKLPGGPVVQVSNFGTSRQLSIVFKGKDGKPLRKRAKGESETSYKEYLQENQAGIAYMECFAPAYTLDLFKNFMDENGNIDIEAIEATDPELLKMVGYRIPTEDKYSIAPLKIVGFLPKEAGDGIMLPYDITLINGSDFDIDKMYLMRKTLPIRVKKDEEFTHHLQNSVFNKLINKAKQEGRGYNVEKIKEEAWEKVNIFFDKKLTTEEKKEKLGEYYTILSKAYRKYRYETITPTRDRDIRNNKILDMTYEVMTHETTADKMLNPGGFDQQKKMGYAVEAFRNLYKENMSESDVLKLWEELQSKSIDELKELSYKDKNLCFIDTHIQFYKQNAAAGTLIGVFAVHKVAHAILGNDGFRYNGIESSFTIAGNTISGGISIDPERDFTGQYIGKVLGSLVASAADAVKDPILNLMNINNNTATVLCTMIRLGIPFDTAAMFLSQKSIAEILQKHAKESLDSPTSLSEVIKKELKAIESEDTITSNSEINTSELTKEELVIGLVTDNKAVKYKVLKMLSSLLDIGKDVKSLSYPTRFNSISNAVGPLIIDNLMMEYKLKKFPETITSRDGDKITLEDFLARHPMLKQFHRTVKMASYIFHDMPANSLNFRDLLSNLPKNLKSRITSDRKLLSMLSDFYQSYMLISSEAIDSSKLMWYIDRYPAEFIKLLKEDESLKSNPLCAAIRLDVAKQSGRPILKIDTTGVDSDYKESLMSGWADLVKTHPNVAKDLFIYNFFRGGIVFNPQTFMGLVPYQVKENIEGYNESYSNPARIEPYIVIDQFIRNYSSNNQIVPTVKSLEGLNKLDKPVKIGDTVTIENNKDLDAIGESTYFKVKSGNSYILFKVTSSSKYSKVITRITPLGNNGEYLELSTDEIINSAEITSLTNSTEEVDNGIGAINGSDTEVEETITINDVTYTDETFTQFWSGKSETESKVFTKKLKGQSSAYLSRIVSILESKGIKVTEEMQNKIKELYNLTC